MGSKGYKYASLTRITDFRSQDFEVIPISRKLWQNGDYTVAKVIRPGFRTIRLELDSGRTLEVMKGDLIIGALGRRYATLEATGSWESCGDDGKMHCLSGGGTFGKLDSKSHLIPNIIVIEYQGHVHIDGKPTNMHDYALKAEATSGEERMPIVLIFGTSMSAGKTTAAKKIINLLKEMGLSITAAKLAGAGRYRDILTAFDAGADAIYDFVDVGLPTTIVPAEEYKPALKNLLALIHQTKNDVAVIEIGASPLEKYQGDLAIEAIKADIKLSVLCASDPYAVYGVMKSYGFTPDLVTGPATNTFAGIDLIRKLCKVKAMNIIDPKYNKSVRTMLARRLGIQKKVTGY